MAGDLLVFIANLASLRGDLSIFTVSLSFIYVDLSAFVLPFVLLTNRSFIVVNLVGLIQTVKSFSPFIADTRLIMANKFPFISGRLPFIVDKWLFMVDIFLFMGDRLSVIVDKFPFIIVVEVTMIRHHSSSH